MICVDASVAVKWVLPEEDSDIALALFRGWIESGSGVVAPPLLAIEVSNILRQRTRRRELSPTEGTELLAAFLSLPVQLIAPSGIYEAAFALALNNNLSAVYDAQYLALAQLLKCELWTADDRLVRQLGPGTANVRSLTSPLLPSQP